MCVLDALVSLFIVGIKIYKEEMYVYESDERTILRINTM